MEKVNIKFHDNYTVTYQHKKILQFVPELSVDKNVRVITPNIPLMVSTTLTTLPVCIHSFRNSGSKTFVFSNICTNRLYHLKQINLVHFWGMVWILHCWLRKRYMGNFSRLWRWQWMNYYLATRTRWLVWRTHSIREIFGRKFRRWVFYLA